MNKHCYRIIFNPSRQMLMVVADIAKSHVGIPTLFPAKCNNGSPSIHALLKPLAWSCALAMGFVTLNVPAAIIADGSAPKTQQPTIIAGANGTPQINIQTPNSNGVSHNKYQNFDVDKGGAILNNSAVNTQTQLGGLITANPGLAKGEASVILNEINSSNLSHLNGFIEVAGKRADVIIANPAGITCNGCGFINANKTTVTTAQVLLEQGKIAGFEVKNGQIAIMGNGMNDEKSDYTQLIARAVKINAKLHAKDLTITTGKNRLDTRGNIISTDPVADATQGFAIDVANLGGMYANKIRLVGTEQGVGVRNAGHIGASAGNISLSADGTISNSGVIVANQNIAINGQQAIENKGTLLANNHIRLAAKNTLMNADKGQIVAGQNIQLNAAEMTSGPSTLLIAGSDNKGRLTSKGSLTVKGQHAVKLQGGMMAKDSLTVTGGELNLSGADVKAKDITLTATNTDIGTQHARLLATRHTQLTAQKNIDNQQGEIVATGNVWLRSDSLNNSQGVVASQADLKIKTAGIDNRRGNIQGGDVQLNSGKERLDNAAGKIIATKSLELISGEMDNQKGLVQAQKKLTLNTHNLALNNNHTQQTGGILSGGELAIKSGKLSNQQGVIQATNAAVLTASDLNNNQGIIQSQANVDLVVQNHIYNTRGKILSGHNLRVQALSVDNSQGWMKANKNLTITGQRIDNNKTAQAAMGIEGQNVTVTAKALSNQQGTLRAGQKMDTTVSEILNNYQGMLSAVSQLKITDNAKGQQLSLLNDQGVMVSSGSGEVVVNQLTGEGKLLAKNDLALFINNTFTHTGRIQAGERLTARFKRGINNQGIISSSSDLSLATTFLINTAFGEITGGQTHLTASGNIKNTGLMDGVVTHIVGQSLYNLGSGRIYGDAIAIAVKTLVNDKQGSRSAVIAGRESINIGVGDLLNRDHALIYSEGDLTIGGELDQQFKAKGRTHRMQNHSANIESAGDLSVKTELLENKDLHLQLTDDAIEISSQHFEWFDFGNGHRYKIQPRMFNESRYAINDDGSLNPSVGIDYERSNRWRMFEYGNWTKDFYEYRYDRITYETQVLKQDAALIASGKDLILDGDRLNNENARLVAGQNLVLTGSQLNNIDAQGVRRVVDRGDTIYRYKGGGTWETRASTSQYQGENSEEKLSLGLMEVSEQAGGIRPIRLTAAKENPLDWQVEAVSASPLNAEQGIIVTVKSLKEESDVMIKTVGPNITLPDNSLFTLKPGSDSRYLIETDPRFTQVKKWLSSLDIMNGDRLLKRLGDGYYEQRLVREQLLAATGQRLSANYTDDEVRYRALLMQGVVFGEQYQLIPGVALSAEQMANLTTDIVWMVNKEITLPDGSVEQVSVPQVYIRATEADLRGKGALLAGKNILADITAGVLNSGEISGRERTEMSADEIQNSGRLQSGNITLTARKDINNSGGEIGGTDSVFLAAGRDITSETAQRKEEKLAWTDRPASIYVTGDKGKLTLKAIQNVNIIASTVTNTGEKGQTTIGAGKDIHLGTRNISASFDYTHNAHNYYRGETTLEKGVNIQSKGDLTLSAGQNISSKAANVDSQSVLKVDAGRDVTITSGIESRDYAKHTKYTSSGLLSSKTQETDDQISDRTALGSTFRGDTTHIHSGNDTHIQGSNVLGTLGVKITADHQLDIGTSDEVRHESHMSKTTKSGLMSGGGIGFTVGKQSIKQTTDTDSNQKKGSVIGSTAGHIDLTAGGNANIHGSDVIAAGNISMTGSNIHITAAEKTRTDITKVETKQSGLSLSLGGAVGGALNSMVETAQAARATDDAQLKTLQAIKVGLKFQQANQASQLAAAQQPGLDASNNGAFGINLSYGSSRSTSVTKTEQQTASGSHLTAGDNLSLNAIGKGKRGNILVQGSNLNADKNINLTASNDITLTSATNTQTVDSKNSSQGSSVGVGMTAGSGGAGWNVNTSINKGRGFEKGNSQFYTDSEVKAGKDLTLSSGKDTRLIGAQASGERVKARVGGDLVLESQQIIDKYDSKQQNVRASASGGAGNVAVSLGASKTAMHSEYQSVDKQTGINAGKGGFDIRVGHHSQLKGAAIRSEASRDKNRLDTGTLGFSDIENKAQYSVEQQGAGVSTGGSIGGQLISNAASALLAGTNNKDKTQNTTHAAVAEGQIVVRDRDNQKQDVGELSRDTGNAHKKLDVIFDKKAQQQRLERNQLLGEIGQQIKDIGVTGARIKAINDAHNATDTAREAAKKALESEKKNSDPAAVNDYLIQQGINGSGWSIGGDNTRIVDAGTALIQGLAKGDVSRGVANASAPYIANVIGNNIESDAGKLAAHTIANVALALAKDENALAQVTGAVTAEAMGMLSKEIYNKKPSQLTEEEKSTLSAFSSLAAGIAGGLAGGNLSDAQIAVQAGKTTVENNFLHPESMPKGLQDYGQAVASWDNYAEANNLTPEQKQAGLDKLAKGDLPEGADIAKAIVDGYKDGVMIAGAAYLGPAASVGKVVGGAVIAEIANGSYQWFDLSQAGNENKTWDYKGSVSAGITGALAPGRGVWQNVGIASGGALFTDGPDVGSVGSAAVGAWAGGMFGEYAPGIVNSLTGKEVPGFVYDYWGGVASEFSSGLIKDLNKPKEIPEEEKP